MGKLTFTYFSVWTKILKNFFFNYKDNWLNVLLLVFIIFGFYKVKKKEKDIMNNILVGGNYKI